MRASPSIVVAATCALLGLACNGMFREAGKGLATGMAQASQAEIKGAGQTEPGTVVEHTARDIVTGSLDEASQSDRLAELQLVANAAVAAAMRGMANATAFENQSAVGLVTDQVITGAMRAMSRGLDDGTFGKSLDSRTERFSSAMIRGVRNELRDMFPECHGKESGGDCLEKRIIAMSRAASAGMREALTGVIALPMLVLAFIVGAIAAALITWAVMHRHVRRMAE